MARKKIGAMLEEKGLITEFQLVAGLSHQRKWKIRLGKALQELGYIEEKKLFEVIAEQWGMELVDLNQIKIPDEVKRKLARDKGMALMAVPIREEGDSLVVAVSEPDRPDLKAELEKITGMPVRLVLAMDSQVEEISRTLPEKIPVGTVKPVKKAFRKNDSGEVELIEEGAGDTELLLGGKELSRTASEEPIPLEEEPIPLEDEVSKEPETKTELEPLDVGLPELGKQEPAPESEVKIEVALKEAGLKRETVGEDTDELWENAQTVAPVSKQEGIEEMTAEERLAEGVKAPEPSSMSEFYPGQMREIESPPAEENIELKAEEEVVEVSKEALLGEEKPEEEPKKELEQIGKEEVLEVELKKPTDSYLPEGGAGAEGVEKVPVLGLEARPLIGEPGLTKLDEEKKEEPIPMAQQVASLQVEEELSKSVDEELKKKEILQMVIEIDNKLKRLREMVKELKEKLEA